MRNTASTPLLLSLAYIRSSDPLEVADLCLDRLKKTEAERELYPHALVIAMKSQKMGMICMFVSFFGNGNTMRITRKTIEDMLKHQLAIIAVFIIFLCYGDLW